MNEKTKPDEKTENPASPELEKNNELEKLKIERVCRKPCEICKSPYMIKIHELRNNGLKQHQIIDAMKEKHNILFSKSTMSRHFANYFDRQMEITAKIINHDLISEATAQSVHLQRTIELIDLAFKQIKLRATSNNYVFDVSDLEKLMKLRYQVLTGNDDVDKDILAIFQKATDKYGVNLQQGVLFAH
ncbi:MAG: hypothetical protein Q7K35_00920 [bacterium]|nr:hypothetical protein [bacterium]